MYGFVSGVNKIDYLKITQKYVIMFIFLNYMTYVLSDALNRYAHCMHRICYTLHVRVYVFVSGVNKIHYLKTTQNMLLHLFSEITRRMS